MKVFFSHTESDKPLIREFRGHLPSTSNLCWTKNGCLSEMT